MSDDPTRSYLEQVRLENEAREAAKRAGTWREPTDPRRKNRIFGAIEIGVGLAILVVVIALTIVSCANLREDVSVSYRLRGGRDRRFPVGPIAGGLAAGIGLVSDGGRRRWRNREDGE